MTQTKEHLIDEIPTTVKDLDADELEHRPEIIESLCMNCHEKGETRLLLVRIPFFREIVLSSFKCPHCNFRDSSLINASTIAPNGCEFTLRVAENAELNRRVVKSEFTSVSVPELGLDIPANEHSKGELTTVEGVIMRVGEGIRQDLPYYLVNDPDTAAKFSQFLSRLDALIHQEGEFEPFTFIIKDPSGNSFVESTYAPHPDPYLFVEHHARTEEETIKLGLPVAEVAEVDAKHKHAQRYTDTDTIISEGFIAERFAQRLEMEECPEEVAIIPFPCPMCQTDGENRLKLVDIPYFKETLIISFKCETCGFKNVEVKAGGSIDSHGTRTTVVVNHHDDLNRDLLKSDSAQVVIPEIGLELAPGTLGGLFTTVEGILLKVKEELRRTHGFVLGDSAITTQKKEFDVFFNEIDECMKLERSWTLELVDPLSNSFIQSLTPPIADPKLVIERYERSDEENERYGIDALMELDAREKAEAEANKQQ
ncbi:hypothetical protein PCE1_001364 [Barthelona sp. PCE]